MVCSTFWLFQFGMGEDRAAEPFLEDQALVLGQGVDEARDGAEGRPARDKAGEPNVPASARR
jgi:hypothetical protein